MNASKIINKSKCIQQCRFEHQGEIEAVFEIVSFMSVVVLDDSFDLSFVKDILTHIYFR